jgi:hypothetical protein
MASETTNKKRQTTRKKEKKSLGKFIAELEFT